MLYRISWFYGGNSHVHFEYGHDVVEAITNVLESQDVLSSFHVKEMDLDVTEVKDRAELLAAAAELQHEKIREK
jgi:hypothetical protein